MANKILPKIESYEHVKNLKLQQGEVGESSGRAYQIFHEKLSTGQSVLLGVKAFFLMLFTLFSPESRNKWSQALSGRITHYVDYNSLPENLKKTNQVASDRLSKPDSKLPPKKNETEQTQNEPLVENDEQASGNEEKKVITSRTEHHEIQTEMSRYKNEWFCHSKIENSFDCEFNVTSEDDGVTIHMIKLDLEKTFEDEELKDLLKTFLKGVLDSANVKNRSIKEFKLNNLRGQQNLQLYRLGFQLNPNTLGYGVEKEFFTTQAIKESLEKGQAYQGRLNMLASDDLIKFISSEVKASSKEKVQTTEEVSLTNSSEVKITSQKPISAKLEDNNLPTPTEVKASSKEKVQTTEEVSLTNPSEVKTTSQKPISAKIEDNNLPTPTEVKVTPQENAQTREERKSITSSAGQYEIQTDITETASVLTCNSKISDADQKLLFNCEFKVNFEKNQVLIDISKIDLEQKFDDETLKDILKSTLKSVLKPNNLIKEIKIENESGKYNLQLYKMGFKINPKVILNVYQGRAYNPQDFKQYFEHDWDIYSMDIYKGQLSMVASNELLQIISFNGKYITSTSGQYEIQTSVEKDVDTLVCRSKIFDKDQKNVLFDCEFNIIRENNDGIIVISDILLQRQFANDELKDILKSSLKSALLSEETMKNLPIKEIKFENRRGEQNLQFYQIGFELDPEGKKEYKLSNKTWTSEEIEKALQSRENTYRGTLDLVAGNDLLKLLQE